MNQKSDFQKSIWRIQYGQKEVSGKFKLKEVSDLVRGLKLSKNSAKYLASIFKIKMLRKATAAFFCREREKQFRTYVNKHKKRSLVCILFRHCHINRLFI